MTHNTHTHTHTHIYIFRKPTLDSLVHDSKIIKQTVVNIER